MRTTHIRTDVPPRQSQFARLVAERARPSIWQQSTIPKHISFSVKFRFER